MDPAIVACVGCGQRIVDDHGVFHLLDGATKAAERAFYDNEYARSASASEKQPIAILRQLWDRPDAPQNRLLQRVTGDLGGKRVLLIGNGASRKELAFLEQHPRRLVYSDLSPNAARTIQEQFDFTPWRQLIRFAAIDAENLPFEDGSFDVVYGHAMVHHLPEVERFLRGVKRVLTSGGRAVFMDDAFAPVWHYSKQTWLKPLMKYSHRKTGISPEDDRFSMSGGFKESELGPIMRRLELEPFFHRACLLDYILRRGAEKLLPRSLYGPLAGGLPMRVLVRLDRALSGLAWYRRNQIRLIWGFHT
jgi:SAM-dependent methyltransferase